MLYGLVTVIIIAVTENLMLNTYRSFGSLPDKVRRYNYILLWVSSAVIAGVLALGALGVPLPGLLLVK